MRDEELLELHKRLAESSELRPATQDEAEIFDLYDLASYAECELGEYVNADSPEPGRVAELRRRLGWVDPREHPSFSWRRGYWIVDTEWAWRAAVNFLPSPRMLALRLEALPHVQPGKLPADLSVARRRRRLGVRHFDVSDDDGHWCDTGWPEGLHRKIAAFERAAGEHAASERAAAERGRRVSPIVRAPAVDLRPR